MGQCRDRLGLGPLGGPQQFQRLRVRLLALLGRLYLKTGLFEFTRSRLHAGAERARLLPEFGHPSAQGGQFLEGIQGADARHGVLQGQHAQAERTVAVRVLGGAAKPEGARLQLVFQQAHLGQLQLGGLQLRLGVVAGRHAARQPGRLLHVGEQGLPFGLHHAAHLTLADHRQASAAEPGAAQSALHVAGSGRTAHDVLLGAAVTVDASAEVQPLPAERAEFDLHLGQPQRRLAAPCLGASAAGTAVKDQLGGAGGAQLTGPRLVTHPAERLDHVRLARTVRADDGRDPGTKFEPGAVGK